MEKFSEMKYVRPDVASIKKQYLALIKEFSAAETFEKANETFLKSQKLMEEFVTMVVIADVRNTCDMSDKFYEEEKKYLDTQTAKLMPVMKKSMRALLKNKFRPELEKLYGTHMFKDAEVSESLIKWNIIPLTIRENLLSTEYSKTAAKCSCDFRGEKCNFYGLLRHMQSTDREERREAFKAWAGLYEGIAPKLDEIYGKMIKIRCKIAKRLGFKDYTSYAYLARGRYDYDRVKTAEFREAVHKYITPLCARLYKEQAEAIGVDKLRWFDEDVIFPDGNALPQGTPDELVQKAREMYREMSPETGEFFDFMTEYEMFDFVTRENKHLGGYCTMLPKYKSPFIFSNFNGTSADIDVLTHEAGHAFQYFYASRRLPIDNIVGSTSEINEIHSMTMEHFAYPYMEKFFGENAGKYRFAHFTEALKTIPYLVSVDEFQHRVYDNPKSKPADWRRFWKETEQKYMPWRSYDGNEFLEGGGFWMQKQHIFLYPFYYVDYALAQIGAFSLYRKKVEGGDAWGSYLKLCGMGGKYGYFETLEKAGIPLPLNEETVKETAEFAARQAEELKAKI